MIQLVLESQDAVIDVNSSLDDLLTVIEEEKKAIEASDINLVEQALERKLEVEADSRSRSLQLTLAFQKLVEYLRSQGMIGESPLGLTELWQEEFELQNTKSENLFEEKLFFHEWKKTKEVFQRFKVAYENCQIKIEANKYLIEKLLNHHRETYRFWQGIISESQATYGAKGLPKDQVATSTLTIKT
ncbi:MAG: flagellar protein FlgN [Pseudobacteriovorax sp.]|nr:flagellar protein FlgN [Pseudobacteriovorax sp.]